MPRTLLKPIALTLAIAVCTLATPSSAQVQTSEISRYPVTDFMITTLKDGETLEVEFATQGCWHSDTAAFTFTRNTVRVDDQVPVDLSWKEQFKVDNYVASVDRQDGSISCTTISSFTLTRKRDDAVIATRSFLDSNCRGEPNSLSFGALQYKLETESQDQSKWVDKPG